MINKLHPYLIILTLGLLFTSCVSTKTMVYFQEDEAVKISDSLMHFEPTIQIGDLMSINVSAIDAEAAAPFNLYETASPTNPKPLTYLVAADGNINFPVLGSIKVAGLTTKEFTQNLSTRLTDYLLKPIVNIRLLNFKITVLGEVKMPGTYTIPNERISVVEALGLAGDLSIQGKRSSVLLIREQEGKRVFIRMDLTNKKLFNSPYYYLAQNDVIYVEPNKAKINSSAVGANAGIIISSISTVISLIAILTR